MPDESRSIEDEISALIIVHEGLLRHIIGLSVGSPSDRDDVYQEIRSVISERLEVPEGTVQSRVRKFRQLIEEYLGVNLSERAHPIDTLNLILEKYDYWERFQPQRRFCRRAPRYWEGNLPAAAILANC